MATKAVKMSKGKKAAVITAIVAAALATVILLGLILTGYFVGWGPFNKLANERFKKLEGNAEKYSLANVQPIEGSPLEGMNILFLGSSVTYGSASLQESFADFIAKRSGADYVKEAVSGTTLVDEGIDSYISCLQKVDKEEDFDLFICQLSTNDASQGKELGEISESGEFDTRTVCGAIEYIITYVRNAWGCPVVFYTNAYYESAEYAAMVSALRQIEAKYGIGVIDLYTDEVFNDITEQERALYMADAIHPTRAGYLEWWTPKMEEYLYTFVNGLDRKEANI